MGTARSAKTNKKNRVVEYRVGMRKPGLTCWLTLKDGQRIKLPPNLLGVIIESAQEVLTDVASAEAELEASDPTAVRH